MNIKELWKFIFTFTASESDTPHDLGELVSFQRKFIIAAVDHPSIDLPDSIPRLFSGSKDSPGFFVSQYTRVKDNTNWGLIVTYRKRSFPTVYFDENNKAFVCDSSCIVDRTCMSEVNRESEDKQT